jgi:hypothetical protein
MAGSEADEALLKITVAIPNPMTELKEAGTPREVSQLIFINYFI